MFDRMTYEERKELQKQEEEFRAFKADVYSQAKRVSKNALGLSKNTDLDSDMKNVALVLGEYLNERKDADEDVYEIKRRTDYIEKCLEAIKTGDCPTLEELLKEKNTKDFDGFTSSKLFSLTKTYLGVFNQRREGKMEIELQPIPAMGFTRREAK